MSGFDDTLTNLARPKTSAVITVRVIKSFEFRTERSLVLRDVNLETTTVGDLKTIARNGEPTPPLPPLSLHYPVEPQSLFDSNPDPARVEILSFHKLWYA
jgi:Uncharacterized conserved protein (DUF2340)